MTQLVKALVIKTDKNLEFIPQNLHGGMKELTLPSCPLTSVSAHSVAHLHTFEINVKQN